MQIIHQIENHLDRRDPAPLVETVMSETARAVAVSFFEKELPWSIPTDVHITVRCRNDFWGTEYDSLPDGGSAYTVVDNTATVVLSPALLSRIGINHVQLVLTQNAAVLATFTFHVRVQPDPYASVQGCTADETNPTRCQQAVADSIAAAQRAEDAAERAEDAAQRAEAAGGDSEGCVKSVNGELPDENGNVDLRMEAVSAPNPYSVRFGMWDDEGNYSSHYYNGQQPADVEIERGFHLRQGEQSEYDARQDLLGMYAGMPTILMGTFHIHESSEETMTFERAYAFSDSANSTTGLVIVDPKEGILYHFVPTENGYTLKTTAIGETGGGAEWRLARSITLESDVTSIGIDTDDDGNPLNFSEGYIAWENPIAPHVCGAYLYITGENGSISNKPFGILSSASIAVKTFWFFSRLNGKLLLKTSGSSSSNQILNDGTYPSLLDIGNITSIKIATDGRVEMMTGATLNLYVKE